ncbi:hypothetical protein ACHQM5_030250 [Ranunculus cassubicifolius]
MRAGLSTIQQTLTTEAANILNQSISEAGRRNHGQTTPLHVAATLLASPSGYLRQACIRSHPNSSHPLQCRALELCFSVALDRLPSAQSVSPSIEPPISNALMAALKRAQAHQRRGCPEQQQQPLLAVKVELEQLIISILDDPSVSRVMREASFSSPAVKATIEQSLNSTSSSNSTQNSTIGGSGLGGFRPAQSANRNMYVNPRLNQSGNSNSDQSGGLLSGVNRNMYLNPRLLQSGNTNSDQSGEVAMNRNSYMNPRLQPQGNSDQSLGQRKEEVKKLVDIMLRSKKRNPVLVGESEPELVVKELLQRIEKKELGESMLRNVEIVSLEKEFGSDRSKIQNKLKELGGLIDDRIGSSSVVDGVILNLGDLRWLVDQPAGVGNLGAIQAQQQQIVSETGRVAVAEMGKLLARFAEGSLRLWMIGTATCETYLRCQVYHPSMENEWDLQAVPIAARSPLPGLFPRMGSGRILSNSGESLSPMKNFPTMASSLSQRLTVNSDPARKGKCCPSCLQNSELELAKLKAEELVKSSLESEPQANRSSLPQWLQNAKPDNDKVKSPDNSQNTDQSSVLKQKTEEVQKKWADTCLRVHPSFHHNVASERNPPSVLNMRNTYNLTSLGSQSFQPKLPMKNLGGILRLTQNTVPERPAEHVASPPQSPVRTDLALGCPKVTESIPEKDQTEQIVRDLISRLPSKPAEEKFSESKKDKLASILDPDSFKSLYKALADKVSWQNDAASAVAATVIECRSGTSKRRDFGRKGDAWLLFAGPDRVGKKKMATALSELICRTSPVTIRLGSRSNDDADTDVTFRGKTSLDRIAEAVERNPSSVVVLEDIDQADILLRGSIKRAFERGRLPDSRGREVSLKNVIFILTANGLEDSLKEEKLANLARKGSQLHLSVSAKNRKRGLDWLTNNNRNTKARSEVGSGLSFDLNEAAFGEDDRAEGSLNSSDLTVEHDQENNLILTSQSQVTAIPHDLLSCVDEAIVFKPVDFSPLQNKVRETISTKFSSIVGEERLSIEVENEVIEHVVGGIWFGRTELEEWADKVLVPSLHQLKNTLPSSSISSDNSIAKLTVKDSGRRGNGDLLPSMITVTTEEV